MNEFEFESYSGDGEYFKIKSFEHFVFVVLEWAEKRDLLTGTDNVKQFKKLKEEVGELTDNIIDGNSIKDDIGDILVVLVQMLWRVLDEGGENIFETMRVSDCTLKSYTPLEEYKEDVYHKLLWECYDSLTNITLWVVGGSYEYWPISSFIKVLLRFEGEDILKCCEIAFNDIKDRKGKMVNGSFVKEV